MKTIFTFCFLVFSFLAFGQEVKLSFEKQKILLGEQMKVKIESIAAAGEEASFIGVDTLPHFEVLESSKVDSFMVNGKLRITQTITVTSWDSGRWTVPTVIVNGTPSKPIAIDVSYTSPWNPKQPYHDIKGIIPVKHPGKSTWWWYVIGAAVLIALFLLFFPDGKKEKSENLLDANAYKKAMQQLDKLQKEGTATVNVKAYHTDLIHIFRTYLKGSKGIQSFSKTTDDLAVQLQSLNMPSAAFNQLLQILRLSDLVKFAQYKPQAQVNQEAIETIKQSITIIENRNVV